MIISHQHIFSLKLIILLIYVLLIFKANAKSQSRSQNHVKDSQQNHSVSAILVFGDSTSDPGNNNFILTPFKGNFPPYGRDFPNRIPTGRFTNGLLASDLIGTLALLWHYFCFILSFCLVHEFSYFIVRTR